MSKINVGFICQTIGIHGETNSYCGVGIRGKLTTDILTKYVSDKYNFIPIFVNTYYDVEKFIIEYQPKIIIYNYHSLAVPWMNDTTIRDKYSHIHHVMIHYDLLQSDIDNFFIDTAKFVGFKHVITDNVALINPKPDENNFFTVTRSVPFKDNIKIDETREDSIPIIGFQGFGLGHKGTVRIAEKIQEEFDEAIFRLHMPMSFFCDPHGHQAQKRIMEICQCIRKPGIKIEISRDFLPEDKIIEWMNQNTINCYFFDYMEGAGIASSPDYAIAAMRPIAVNNSRMLINLHGLDPSIEIENNSLRDIIKNGVKPLLPIYDLYKQINVIRDYENICDRLLTSTGYRFINLNHSKTNIN